MTFSHSAFSIYTCLLVLFPHLQWLQQPVEHYWECPPSPHWEWAVKSEMRVIVEGKRSCLLATLPVDQQVICLVLAIVRVTRWGVVMGDGEWEGAIFLPPGQTTFTLAAIGMPNHARSHWDTKSQGRVLTFLSDWIGCSSNYQVIRCSISHHVWVQSSLGNSCHIFTHTTSAITVAGGWGNNVACGCVSLGSCFGSEYLFLSGAPCLDKMVPVYPLVFNNASGPCNPDWNATLWGIYDPSDGICLQFNQCADVCSCGSPAAGRPHPIGCPPKHGGSFHQHTQATMVWQT